MNGCGEARVSGPPGAATDTFRVAIETARSRVQHRIKLDSPMEIHVTELKIDNVFDLVLEKAGSLIAPVAHTARMIDIIDYVCRFGAQACDYPDVVIDIANALSEASEDTLLGVTVEPQWDSGPTEVDLDSRLRLRVARNLLLGEAGSIDRSIEASAINIDTGRDYVAFRAHVRRGRRGEELAAELGLAETRQPRNSWTGIFSPPTESCRENNLVGALRSPWMPIHRTQPPPPAAGRRVIL